MTLEDDEKDVLAAEYVLGTLDTEDRANVQMLLALDPAFAAIVTKWERHLGGLSALVESVDPPSDTWEWIKVRTAGVQPSAQMWLPGVNDPPPSPEPAKAETPQPPAEAAALTPAAVESSSDDLPANVVRLSRGVSRWRALAAIAALAAVLLLALLMRPDVLPESMQPAPKIVEREIVRTVEVPSPKMAEYVAVLQKDGGSPAFLVTLDTEKRTLSVRKAGAPAEAGKDYELWLKSNASPELQSLGVVGEGEFTVRRNLAAYDGPTLRDATFAISLEPTGGSTTGKPSGPPIFTGKLMQLTPPAFPSQTP